MTDGLTSSSMFARLPLRLDSLWDRLPTPTPSSHHISSSPLISPPLSRAPSNHGPDSTRSSSEDSRMLAPEALPSPQDPPAGSKTNAFFATSFLPIVPPTPPPPPQPPIAAKRSEKTYGDLPSSAHTSSDSESAQAQAQPRSVSDSTSPTVTRSNADFFASPVSHVPTPPPSIRSVSYAIDDHAHHHRLPPLARFFPSRAPPADSRRLGEDLEYGSSLSRSSSTRSSRSALRREFVTLEESSEHSTAPSSPASSPVDPVPAPPPPVRRLPHHLSREALSEFAAIPKHEPSAGAVISGENDSTPLTLVRPLGQGAFSSVWLALDPSGKLSTRSRTALSRARSKRDQKLDGLKPAASRKQRGDNEEVLKASEGSVASVEGIATTGRLVAVKMMDRALCDANDRTRISFVREVEVLRHISHPSIVSYLHSFTTPTHHCLVLEHLQGGELFDLLNADENYAKMTEPLLRRMWGELCRAVGWMHGVALVHRDIKLENILLTCNPFLHPSIESVPSPLLKLTDFGLARFIDPKAPLLTTRCGSESYAAPEIVTGQPYDGRQTDAWACGVVLYALATRTLPFEGKGSRSSGSMTPRESRRSFLMRIASADYSWPSRTGEPNDPTRLATDGLKRVVRRLLVRDPAKRARINDLWNLEEWMTGEGAPSPPTTTSPPPSDRGHGNEDESGEGASDAEHEDEQDGELVDEEHIGAVASQEML